MGSTADDLQYEQREQTSPQRVMVASGAGTTGAAVKWRIAQRVVPINDHDLVLTPIDPDKLHPLVSVSSSAKDETAKPVTDVVAPVVSTPLSSSTANLSGDAEQKASTTSLSGGATEVVALEAGELDPLGALAMGLSIEGVSGQKTPASVDATQRSSMSRTTSFTSAADQALGTIKHLWTAHKDRVLAKLSDETFTIKASMLETNDIEGELSYSSTSEYQSREEDGLMTSSADGTAVVRKSRARLEQLERRHSSVSTAASLNRAGSTVKITQREYVARIKQMQADLVKAWQQNMKVQALRIAIKCVKQLSDTSSAPQLYPLAFVLVSDVLDEFGQLVFTRIKARASEDENGQPLPTPLGERFTSDEVNIHAKETCRNWFYKTACIRELLPRIYIEIALLKSYRFLGDGEFPQIVARLSNMIKGVGEPMVALYTRLYLALASTELVNPSEKAAVLSSLYDYFFAFQQYQDQGKLTQFLYDQNLTHNDYLELHSPAVEWLMKCTAQHATNEVFEALLEQYQEYSGSSMVLKHLCESFGASSYASDPMRIFHLMRVASPSQFSKCHLYSVLAVQLSTTPSIGAGSKDAKLRFLNEAWSSITAQEDIEMYMECAAAYMKLIVSHYVHREATILLKDVMRHLNSTTPDELTPKLYNLLGAFIENVVYGAQQHAEFFTRLIPSGEFLSLMGMFRREASVGVAKKVLQAFVNAQGSQKNNFGNLRLHVVGPEAAVAHTLFVICCRVHDALDSLSTASERNDATKDIAAFILRLGYARHPLAASSSTALSANMPTTDAQLQEEEEALLMFYIDCRSAFYKLEPIKSVLTKCVTALALRVRERMLSAASRHKSGGPRVTDRRRDFIKSCLAYAHITIPSIDQAFPRLELLALCAKAALINNCLPQLEAFLKSAIVLVADLDYVHSVGSTFDGHLVHEAVYPDMSDAEVDPVLRVIRELVQIVTYAPSTVDDEPFYFVEALRKALLERMKWDDATSSTSDRVRLQASSCRIRVITAVAQLYATWGQSRLPSRVEGVVSNDVLYGVDDAFQQQTQMAFSAILDQVVRDIEALSSAFTTMPSWEVASMQTELLVELVSVVFPFLSFEEDQAPGDGIDDKPTAPTELMEEDRRQNKRGRSGATLLRKCLLFAMEKLRIVTDEPDRQYQEKKGQRVEALKVKLLDVVKSLHEYAQYQQKKRALLYSAVAGQALNALETVTSTLTGPA